MIAARNCKLILVGCSAGGVDALKKIISALPANFCAPVVAVIHLFPQAQGLISQILQPLSQVVVKEAEDKEELKKATVYFAPPNYHVLVEPEMTLSFSVDEPVHFSRPSIDVLFESAAVSIGAGVVAMVLTGANEDGAEGLRCVIEHGGAGIVQDPLTAEYSEMPAAALALSKNSTVLSLESIIHWLNAELK